MSGLGNKEILSKNLKRYMRLHGKDRSEMVEAIGVSYSTFNDWYNGKNYPRIDKIEMLANYFGIQKSDLIEEKSDLVPTSFKNAEEALKFILQQDVLMAYGGYDLDKMSEEELIDIAENMLMTLKISLERRKKKRGE